MASYTLSGMRYTAKYIAQLFKEIEFDPRVALPVDECAGYKNVSALSLAPLITDPTNYWIAWGGTFDNPVALGLQVFFNLFLSQLETFAAMASTENSFYVDTTNYFLFINTSYMPWEYFDLLSYLLTDENSAFASAPKNERNPLDIFYGSTKALARLVVPSFTNKLSDSISGITKYDSFTFTIFNDDGNFDGQDITQYFNTPVRLLKDSNNAQSLLDFKRIRTGIVDNIKVKEKTIKVRGTDQLYKFTNSVCNTISTDFYASASSDAVGTNIPIAWGEHNGVELIEVWNVASTTFYYLALDKDWITSVSAVYDGNGASQSFTFLSSSGLIVTNVAVETADVMGRTDNRLGKIIVELIQEKEGISYVDGLWDTTETDLYLGYCDDVTVYFNTGTTKKVLKDLLKNDLAFVLQKNNGLLTIRRWGQTYDIFTIPEWLTTGFPEKDFGDAQDNFCSSVRVNYNGGSYLNDTQEAELRRIAKLSYTADLTTYLDTSDAAEDLSDRFLDRFGTIKPTLSVSLGCDTYQINLLDTIIYDPNINGRQFETYTNWIVKQTNPGQDKIVMEAIEDISG